MRCRWWYNSKIEGLRSGTRSGSFRCPLSGVSHHSLMLLCSYLVPCKRLGCMNTILYQTLYTVGLRHTSSTATCEGSQSSFYRLGSEREQNVLKLTKTWVVETASKSRHGHPPIRPFHSPIKTNIVLASLEQPVSLVNPHCPWVRITASRLGPFFTVLKAFLRRLGISVERCEHGKSERN